MVLKLKYVHPKRNRKFPKREVYRKSINLLIEYQNLIYFVKVVAEATSDSIDYFVIWRIYLDNWNIADDYCARPI